VAVYDSSTETRSLRIEFLSEGIRLCEGAFADSFFYSDIIDFECVEPKMREQRTFDVMLRSGRRVSLFVPGEFSSGGVDGWAEVYNMHRLLVFVRFLFAKVFR
jgi:hypothetical protein